MRFRLRSLLVLVTVVALLAGAVAWVRNQYYVQLRRVNSVIAEFPEIGSVWLVTNDDVELEVKELYFSTRDRPNEMLGIDGIDGASEAEIRTLVERELRERRPVVRPIYATPYID